MPTPQEQIPSFDDFLKSRGTEQPANVWTLDRAGEIRDFYRQTFGRELPVSAFGESSTHRRMHLDHSEALDIPVQPNSAEGKAILSFLDSKGFPYLAYEHAVAGAATGPHIHVGYPSKGTGAVSSPQGIPTFDEFLQTQSTVPTRDRGPNTYTSRHMPIESSDVKARRRRSPFGGVTGGAQGSVSVQGGVDGVSDVARALGGAVGARGAEVTAADATRMYGEAMFAPTREERTKGIAAARRAAEAPLIKPVHLSPQEEADVRAEIAEDEHSSPLYRIFKQPAQEFSAGLGAQVGNVLDRFGVAPEFANTLRHAAFTNALVAETDHAKDDLTGYLFETPGKALYGATLNITELMALQRATGGRVPLPVIMAGQSLAQNMDKPQEVQAREAGKSAALGLVLEKLGGLSRFKGVVGFGVGDPALAFAEGERNPRRLLGHAVSGAAMGGAFSGGQEESTVPTRESSDRTRLETRADAFESTVPVRPQTWEQRVEGLDVPVRTIEGIRVVKHHSNFQPREETTGRFIEGSPAYPESTVPQRSEVGKAYEKDWLEYSPEEREEIGREVERQEQTRRAEISPRQVPESTPGEVSRVPSESEAGAGEKQPHEMTYEEIKERGRQLANEKEPWEMSRDEFDVYSRADFYPDMGVHSGNEILAQYDKYGRVDGERRWVIERALEQGKTVPPEVLKDYPDLSVGGTPVKGEEGAKFRTPEEVDAAIDKGVLQDKFDFHVVEPKGARIGGEIVESYRAVKQRGKWSVYRAKSSDNPFSVGLHGEAYEKTPTKTFTSEEEFKQFVRETQLPTTRAEATVENPKSFVRSIPLDNATLTEFEQNTKLNPRQVAEQVMREEGFDDSALADNVEAKVANAYKTDKVFRRQMNSNDPRQAFKEYVRMMVVGEGKRAQKAERIAYSPAIQDAFKAWNENRAYVDNAGNYHLRPEAATPTRKRTGPVAPWNREVKNTFKDSAEFHAAAQVSGGPNAAEPSVVGGEVVGGGPSESTVPTREQVLQSTVLPGAKEFVEKDIIPTARNVGVGLTDTIKGLVHVLSPRSGVPTRGLDVIMQMKGERDKAQFVLESSMADIRKAFDRMPRADQIDFLDKIKTGHAQATPELQQIADAYRTIDDNLHSEIKKWRPTAAYLDNHFRVLWKVVPGSTAQTGFRGLFRRPLEGSKGFLKQHTLDTVSDGITKGGEPVSYNPQVLFETSYADAMKFITAQRMWKGIKDAGFAQFVRFGEKVPDGFTRLADPLARVYFPADEGMVNAGEWYVEDGVGRILNNHLSRDYIREAALGRGALWLKNQMTAVELGLSAFHAVFETNEAVSSQIGIGLRRFVNLGLLRLDPKEAAKGLADIVRSPVSPAETARTGGSAIKYLSNKADFLKTTRGQSFLKAFPDADELLDDLFTGGGRLAMHEDYKTKTTRAFNEAIKEGNYPGALIRSLPALNEQVMKPLFEVYIPRLKVGQFLKEYSLALQEHEGDLSSGKMTRPELARQTWDFVEDRYGEMNFDNLFWNRTFKSAAQLLFRSVTWKLGNLRATLGAVPEQGREFYDAARDLRTPLLQPKMAWLAGQSLVTAALGTIIMKSATGLWPQSLTDMVYPRTDKDDPSQRIAVPTYWKDIIALYHSPGDYIASSASSEFSRALEVYRNKDYYGTEVYDPEDPLYKEAFSSVAHFFPVPFSIRSFTTSMQQGQPVWKSAASFGGFSKAPAYLSKSAAQQMMDEILGARRPQGARTQEEATHSLTKYGLVHRRQNGEPFEKMKDEVDKAVKDGELTLRDGRDIIKAELTTKTQHDFEQLDIGNAVKVFQAMTPEEQDKSFNELMQKRTTLPNLLPQLKDKIEPEVDSIERQYTFRKAVEKGKVDDAVKVYADIKLPEREQAREELMNMKPLLLQLPEEKRKSLEARIDALTKH